MEPNGYPEICGASLAPSGGLEVAKLFEDRRGLIVYFERDEIALLRSHARKRCMMLGPWLRSVALHLAAMEGAFPPERRPGD
jgi:hypothetical protein